MEQFAMAALGAVLTGSLMAGAMVAAAQTGSVPLKPGLWENTSRQVSSGVTMTPEMEARLRSMPPDQAAAMRSAMSGGGTDTTVSESCVTRETLDSLLRDPHTRGTNCTRTRHTEDSRGMTMDIVCHGESGRAISGHWQILYDSSEAAHGTTHVDITQPGGGTAMMKVDTDLRLRYLGADCKGIAPGDSKVIRED